jgi:hypothetical protein
VFDRAMEVSLNAKVDIRSQDAPRRARKGKRSALISREAIHELLKKGIWFYFLLLIFEGALRKWVLPGLAAPLLIVRDPVAIWLLYTAWRYDELPLNNYIIAMTGITVFSFFTAITIGHGNMVVAIYGARIFLFHFPLIFLIGRIFNRDDVLKLGNLMLWISIPMLLLIALQFYSPQSSFVNRGLGGDAAGGGFSGALGYFRPPGTFSFTTGNTQFFGLVSVFVIYFLLNPMYTKMPLLLGATICVLCAIPLSISRSLFLQVLLSAAFAGVSIVRKPKYLGRMIIAILAVILLGAILSKLSFFSKAIDALTNRFEVASDSEGSIQDSFANRMFAGFFEQYQSSDLPFFGLGLGMGTNVGAQLLVGNNQIFLISEGEWGRLVGEMGILLGVSAIVIRINLCLRFVVESYKRLLRSDLLPWMLLSICFQLVAQGQWAQPTTLGFAIVLGGLSIASLNYPTATYRPNANLSPQINEPPTV